MSLIPNLKTQAVSGVRWTVINALGEKLLSFGTTMVLARILDPEHFGLYALAFVAIDSFSVFKNLGLDAAIIQRRDRVEDAATTALCVLPVIGVALYALLYVGASSIAGWLGHPEAMRPIQALGTILVVAGLSSVPLALIRKSMRFEIQAVSNLTGMVIYAAVAIVLAWRGWNLWSLVIAYLARWAVAIPVQWVLLRWRPSGKFDWALLKEMIGFSKYVVAAWSIAFVTASVDKIAIGRWLGTTELGYYTLCLGLANFATAQLSTRIFQVAFPAFTAAQAKPELLRAGFIKLTKYLIFFALPLALLMILLPRELLGVFYGKRWMKAAGLLQILAVGGALQAIRVGVEPVLLGCGRSKTIFRLNLLQLCLLLAGATTMAIADNLYGVAWAVVVAIGVPCVIGLWLTLRQVGIRAAKMVRELRPVVLSLATMTAAILLVHLAHEALRAGIGELLSIKGAWLIGVGCTGGVVYLASIIWWDRAMAKDILQMLRPAKPAPAGPTTILFVESGSGHGGSATCLANLVCWLDATRYRPIVAYYADGVGIGRIREMGIPTYQLKPGRRVWQLLQLIRRERVALMHSNNEIYSQVPAIVASALTRVPCVCNLRAARPMTRRERVWVPFVRLFISVSEAVRQTYLRSGIPADAIETVWDGINLEEFPASPASGNGAPVPEIPLRPDRLTVGLVCRLIPEKGIQEFLEAARRVVDVFPAVQFVLVGGDPTPDERHLRRWKALASQLSLADRVVFTGWRADIPAVTARFDIAAQASKYWEGWGMSLLEAMACGKPVVATRIGGVPEVVEEGKTGFLVEPGNPSALAEALLVLLRGEALRRLMGEAGRRRAEQCFDQRQQVREMEALYARVLNGRVGG